MERPEILVYSNCSPPRKSYRRRYPAGSGLLPNRHRSGLTHPFIPYLEKRLRSSLPGRQAQLKMAPEPLGESSGRRMEAPDSANRSGVLVLLFPNDEGELELVLTLRSRHIDHGGQLSFPGGRTEEGETARETALREAGEEVGVAGEEVRIIGSLSELYIANSNNYVTPVVGCMESRPPMRINPEEVDEVFAVELNSLAGKKNLETEQWELKESRYHVPYWKVHRVPLWGATAMMLSELMEIYREWREQSG